MKIQSYLFFNGRCEEAIDFYCRAIGAEITMLLRYGESPSPPPPGLLPPGSEKKIMHAAIKVGENTVLLSDGHCSGQIDFKGFSLALSAAELPAAERIFAALADGGKVQQVISKTFFSPGFGMLTDRFGVGWMVMVQAETPASG